MFRWGSEGCLRGAVVELEHPTESLVTLDLTMTIGALAVNELVGKALMISL